MRALTCTSTYTPVYMKPIADLPRMSLYLNAVYARPTAGPDRGVSLSRMADSVQNSPRCRVLEISRPPQHGKKQPRPTHAVMVAPNRSEFVMRAPVTPARPPRQSCMQGWSLRIDLHMHTYHRVAHRKPTPAPPRHTGHPQMPW